MSALPDDDLLMAFLDFAELERAYAEADALDETFRSGWIPENDQETEMFDWKL